MRFHSIRESIYKFSNIAFGIQREEFRLVQMFFIYFILISCAYTFSATGAITLFLSRTSPSQLHHLLPWLLIGNAVTIGLISRYYQKFIDRFSRIKLISWITIFFIGVFLILRILIYIVGDNSILYFSLMICDETSNVVLTIVFYSFLGDYFYVHSARRVYAYISGAIALGASLSGFSSAMLLHYISTPDLFYISAITLALSNMVAFWIWKTIASPKHLTVTQKENPIIFKKILSNKYIIIILILVGLAVVCSSFDAYQLFYIASKTLNEEAMGNFMGKFYGSIGIAVLIVNYVLGKWLLRHLGILNSLLIMPILLIFLSVAFIGSPVLSFAAAIKFADGTLAQSLNLFATQLLYLPLAQRVRMNTQALSGIMASSGRLFAGLVILLFSIFYLPIQFYALVILLSSILWLVCIFLLYPLYKKTLTTSLKKFDIDPQDLARLLHDSEARLVIEKLVSEANIKTLLVILPFFSRDLFNYFKPKLLDFLDNKNYLIVIEVIKLIGKYGDKNDIRYIANLFKHQYHEEIQVAAISALANLAPKQNYIKLDTIFKTSSLHIQKEYLKIYYASLSENEKNQVRNYIDRALSVDRIGAIQLIAATTDPIFTDILHQLLLDADSSIVKEAIIASKNFNDSKTIDCLIHYLSQKNNFKPLIERSLSNMPPESVGNIIANFYDNSISDASRYILLLVIGRIDGERALQMIIEVLKNKDSKLLTIGACHALTNIYVNNKLSSSTLKSISHIREDILSRLEIIKQARSELNHLPRSIKIFFEDTFYFYMMVLFYLLSVEYRIDEFKKLPRMLLVRNKSDISACFELLETVLSKNLFKKIKRLLFILNNNANIAVFSAHSNVITLPTIKKLLNLDPWVRALTIHALKITGQMEKLTNEVAMTEKDNQYFYYIEVVTFLKSVDLFKNISTNYLVAIAEIVQQKTYYAGEYIFKEADEGNALFIIRSGVISLRKGEKEIAKMKAGDCIGELSLLDRLPHVESAYVIEDSEVYSIDLRNFENILETYPEVAEGLLIILARRLREVMLT